MVKFLAWIGFMIVVVLMLPGCESSVSPSTTVEKEESLGLSWDFGDKRYIIEVIGEGIDTCFYTGNFYPLPIGKYWIGCEPDCDSGITYYSFNIELKAGEGFDVTRKVLALQGLL